MSLPTEERKLFRPHSKEKQKKQKRNQAENFNVLKCRDKQHATRAARDVTVLSTKWVRCAADETQACFTGS